MNEEGDYMPAGMRREVARHRLWAAIAQVGMIDETVLTTDQRHILFALEANLSWLVESLSESLAPSPETG